MPAMGNAATPSPQIPTAQTPGGYGSASTPITPMAGPTSGFGSGVAPVMPAATTSGFGGHGLFGGDQQPVSGFGTGPAPIVGQQGAPMGGVGNVMGAQHQALGPGTNPQFLQALQAIRQMGGMRF